MIAKDFILVKTGNGDVYYFVDKKRFRIWITKHFGGRSVDGLWELDTDNAGIIKDDRNIKLYWSVKQFNT
jgi:hypothetical protein